MASLTFATVLATGGLLVWAFLNQRGRLKREVDSKLLSTLLVAPDGVTVFDGKQALVLLKDYAYLGTEETGPQLSAKYLCRMPAASAYWVVVDSSSDEAPATAQVSELSPAEIDDVLATYPYLAYLKANLPHPASSRDEA